MDKIYCPVNGWDCLYWQKDGSCSCENVEIECDDYAAMEQCMNDDDPNHIYIF